MTFGAPTTNITMTAKVKGKRLLAHLRSRHWSSGGIPLGLIIATWATYAAGGSQTVFPDLFYIPILIAAFVFRSWGGFLIGVAAGLLCGPLMPLDVRAGIAQPPISWIIRTGIFAAVGVLSGAIIDAHDRHLARMAALHEQSVCQEKELKALNERLQAELTARHRAEGEARREAAGATALARFAARLNAQRELDTVLNMVCEETARELKVPAASVSLYDQQRGMLSLAATFGLPPEYLEFAQALPRTLDEEDTRGLGSLTIGPSALVAPRQGNSQLHVHDPIRTIVVARLIRENDLIGTLDLYTFGESRAFSDGELTLLTRLAHQATQAITYARLAAQADRHSRQLRALRTIDMAITTSLELCGTLNVILDQVITQLSVDATDVLLLNPKTQTLELAAGLGFHSRPPQCTRLRLGEGYAGRVARDRRIVNIPNLPAATRDFQYAPSLASENFITYYGVPLVVKGQVKGVLEIFHRTPLDPDTEWLEFLEALANQAALAIDNDMLLDDLQRSNADLALAYDTTLEGWSRALDLRDAETEGHTQRVTEMTVRLARAMGMSEVHLVHVRRGALLHDIGKMGVPDAILLKLGPLTDTEWEIMRRHPVSAYELLSPIAFLRPALDIPHCHHEKWDGSGYPRGLKGEEIPLAARIFAVVDVWDALRSDRPYRPAWSEERVREHIHSLAGTHFDPHVAQVFLEMLEGPHALELVCSEAWVG